MNQSIHNNLVSFIWSIADDCLRDIYVRGKYRDVILLMVVLRRLDSLLEATKEKVLKELEFQQKEMEFTELDGKGLQDASGYVFYNTSKWTLQQLFYGKEINDETYAICKSDMMIKGNNPENIRNGSTLAVNEFARITSSRN